MGVQLVDCTIRDGGYLLNKNSDPQFVKGVIQGLVDSGIDFVETGFLQNEVNGETIIYRNSKDIIKYLPHESRKTNFLGFCDNSRYSLENLDGCDGNSFKWLRISLAKHEIDEALEFCKGAMNKGYSVQFNPMDAISYTDAERKELIRKVNYIRPASFSIVDTFGAMDMKDLIHIYEQVDKLLDRSIKIGLHSHDNLGLSCALAERMVELSENTGREVILDGSLLGMGRGAGNAKIELLANYLNKHCGTEYNIRKILETINTYIIPLTQGIHWGYDLAMGVCGIEHSHVDNIYHLIDKYGCKAEEMFDILQKLSAQQRTRYGIGYSKTDFKDLDNIYKEYKEV